MTPMDSPTTQISYRIFSPNPFEGAGERWTADEAEAQGAYDRGFMVDKIDIVRAVVSTGQTVTTGLSTEWRGK
jgi:hypothetical protein